MDYLNTIELIEYIRNRTHPDFEGVNGKAFYGKLDKGDLAFFHYIQGPAQPSAINKIAVFGENLEEYKNIISCHNGLIMYDKTLSLYGIGENIKRSLSLNDQIAYRMEDENPIFEVIPENLRRSRVRKIGRIDLISSYDINVYPAGECCLKNVEGTILSIGGIEATMYNILFLLEDFTEFCCELDGDTKRRIEEAIISKAR